MMICRESVMSSDKVPSTYQNLFSKLESKASSSDTYRLSIREGSFRKLLNGKEVAKLEEKSLEAVIIKAARMSRIYYAEEFVADKRNTPVCWSIDSTTGRPSEDVSNKGRQNATCFDCKQNIKGSGQGTSRACRFRQRMAIMLVEDGQLVSDKLYQLDLPSTSIFGKDQKKMSIQAFAKYLNVNKTPMASVLTEIKFDPDSSLPKLCFKPLRPLEESELLIALHAQKDPDTQELVKINFNSSITSHDYTFDVDNVFDVVSGEGVYIHNK